MTSGKKSGTRVGAGAFVVGLSLLGPQALGVACAEAGEAETTASVRSSGAPAAEAASANRAARRAAAVSRVSRAASGSPAGVVLPVRPAAAGGSVLDDAVAERGGGAAPIPAVGLRARSGVRAAASTPSGSVRVAVPVASGTVAAVVPTAAGGVGRPAVFAAPPTREAATASAAPVPAFLDTAVATFVNNINTVEASFFNTLANFLIDLPANSLTTVLETALLAVRQRFFNQAPQIKPSTPYTSSDGTIRGRIGAVDREGDELTYRVVEAPNFGSVTLSADGSYVYTPGSGYAGSDLFTVEVAATEPVFNLLTPLDTNGARVVTIQVGAPPSASGFPLQGLADQSIRQPDVAVYLPGAYGHLTVRKSVLGNLFTGTVTLTDVAPGTQLTWMDSTGDFGHLSLDDAVRLWPEFQAQAAQSGGGVDLGVAYQAGDGTNTALLLTEVAMGTDDAGQYVFTGLLSPNPETRTDSIDRWDVIGHEYKAAYENFRSRYGIEDNPFLATGFTTVEVDFTSAAMFADTASAISYQQDGLYALDHQRPGTLNAPAAALVTSPPSALAGGFGAEWAKSPVTASIELGQSFVIGRGDGSVELWTDGQKQLLQGPNSAAVNYILAYDRPLQDPAGNTIASSFTGSIEGTTLSVTVLGAGSSVGVGQQITGAGIEPGTIVTKYVLPEGASCAEKNSDGDCVRTTGGQAGADGVLGTYEVNIAQTVTSTTITQPSILTNGRGFVVGADDGTVKYWSATDRWVDLRSPSSVWNRPITAMANCGGSVVVGLEDGGAFIWGGPLGQNPDAWGANNWTEVARSWRGGGAVQSIVAVPDGFVLVHNPEVPELPTLSYTSLSDPARSSNLTGAQRDQPVTAVTAYGNGVAVGYADGAVYYWDLRGSNPQSQGPAILQDSGGPMGRPITAMVGYQRLPGSTEYNLVVGYGGVPGAGGGKVTMYSADAASDYTLGKWTGLHDESWGSPVQTMTTFSSAAISSRAGVIVGLGNGSVQLWDGTIQLNSGGQNRWIQLSDPGWGSGVVTLIPFRQNLPDSQGNVMPQDGAVVGLADGSVRQWNGLISAATRAPGPDDWTTIVCGPRGCAGPSPSPRLDQDGLLQVAVDFAKDAAKAGNPTWGAENGVGGPTDPLFYNTDLLPACSASNSCDGQFIPIASYIPKSPLAQTLASDNVDAKVELRYDVNAVALGYAFMPNGFWNKLNPGKWSMAVLAAIETGPALTVTLGEGGTINVPETNLFDWQASTPGPLGFDRVALGLGVNGEVNAQLFCDAGSACPDTLHAHAYLVPGVLLSYNTQADPRGIDLGFNYYPDLDYTDFARISGVSVTTILTPYATLTYGVFTPDNWWLIGGWSLFKLGVGYENPLSATVSTGKDQPTTLTLASQGFLTTHAGVLESLTSKLIWDNSIEVYGVEETLQIL